MLYEGRGGQVKQSMMQSIAIVHTQNYKILRSDKRQMFKHTKVINNKCVYKLCFMQ